MPAPPSVLTKLFQGRSPMLNARYKHVFDG